MGDQFDAFDDLGYTSSGQNNNFEMSSPTLGSNPVADPEEQLRQQRYREKEENRIRELQQKQIEEIEAKNERRTRGKAKLAEMLKNQEGLKKSVAKDAKDSANAFANGKGGPWSVVAGNIALKNGDFPGNKDISRMRDAIVNKAKDGGSN